MFIICAICNAFSLRELEHISKESRFGDKMLLGDSVENVIDLRRRDFSANFSFESI